MTQIQIGRWPRTVEEARRLQIRLKQRLHLRGGPDHVRLVGGADCAFSRDGQTIWAGAAVVVLPRLERVAEAWVQAPVAFPYLPGYLAFREGPAILAAARKLPLRPDLWLFDGQGIAHPRGMGLAAHLGVLLDAPSVGCAKSRLTGAHREPGHECGSRAPLMVSGRQVGTVLRTRTGVRPLYVSVGHRISLSAAVRWVLAACRYRVPEPIRFAEQLVNQARRGCSLD